MPQSPAHERAELKREFNNLLTWAVAVILFITPLTISVRGVAGTGLIKTVVAQSMILVVLAAWLVMMAVSDARSRVFPALHLPILSFACLNALSLLRTSDLGSGLLKLSQLVLFASMAIMCTDIFRRREDVLKVFGAIALAGFFVSAYGIAQHYGKDFIHWEVGQLDIRKAPATLGNPNFAAQFLVGALPISVAVLLVLPGFWRRVSVSICTCMMLVHLSFTRARAGLVGLTAAAAVMVLALIWNRLAKGQARVRARGRWLLLILIVALLMGGAGLMTRGYPHLTLRMSDENIMSRILTWRSALTMIRDNPIRGVGLGDFYATMPLYWSPYHQRAFVEQDTVTRRVHNDYLEIAAETGIPSLATFLLLITVTAVLIGRQAANESCVGSRAVLAGIGASLAGISAQAAFTFSLQNASSALLFWTLIGLGGSMIRSGTRGSTQSGPTPRRRFSRTTRILLYLLAIVCICLVPARFRTMGADYRVRAAQALMEREKFEEAAAELDRAISLDPLNFDALFKRGGAAVALREDQKAERAYRRCLELRPNDVLTLTNLGLVLLNEARVDEALPLLRKALCLAPNHRTARRAAASCYMMRGEPHRAVAELREANHYYPRDAEISLDLARCYRGAGATEEAIGQYEKALSMDMHNAPAAIELGSLHLAQGNHTRATHLLERGLLLQPTATEGRVALARAYLAGGRLLEAALECGNYVTRGGADKERARSLALQIAAELGTAGWRSKKPRAELVRFVLARIFLAFGEPERALEQLRQIAGHNDSILFHERVRRTASQLEKRNSETGSGRADGA